VRRRNHQKPIPIQRYPRCSIAVEEEFSPADISGLKLWLKADGTLWQDSARTTPASADGDPVGAWDDASGEGNHVLQTTNGLRPLLKINIVNGEPAVLFDGSDDYLDGSYAAAVPQPRTLFLVVRSANPQFTITDSTSGNRNIVQTMHDGAGHRQQMYAGTGPLTGTAGLSTTNFFLLTVKFNGASSAAWHNGAADISGDAGNLSVANGPRFGANVTPGQYWPGYIAEVLDYAAELSAANREAVEDYLNDKYAIY
jgi:hypothetical protein